MSNYFREYFLVFSLCALQQMYPMENVIFFVGASTSIGLGVTCVLAVLKGHIYDKHGFTNEGTLDLLLRNSYQRNRYTEENLEKIKDCIYKGANPNMMCSIAPLYVLIETLHDKPEKFAQELQNLIKHGMHINNYIKDMPYNNTALSHVACKSNILISHKLLLLESLICNGADVNKKSSYGEIPLVSYLENYSFRATPAVIEKLCKHKSQLMEVDNKKRTIFHALIKYECDELQIKAVMTHANCFSLSGDEDMHILKKTLWTLKYWGIGPNNNVKLASDLKFYIISKLFLGDNFFHKGLCDKLIGLGYNNFYFPQLNARAKYFINLLETKKDGKNRSSLQLFEKYKNKYFRSFVQVPTQAPAEVAKLFNVNKWKQDRDVIDSVFQKSIENGNKHLDISLIPLDNLVFQCQNILSKKQDLLI